MISNTKDENKAEISKLRIKLGNYVIKTFRINPAPKIMNRSKLELMFADIWYFLLSIEENFIQIECNEIFKSPKNTLNESQQLNSSMNGTNVNETNYQLEKKIDRLLNELVQTREKLLSELEDVKDQNKKIMDDLKLLKNENSQLKKIILEQGKFKNFNLYNNDNNMNDENECMVLSETTDVNDKNVDNSFKIPENNRKKISYAKIGLNVKSDQNNFNVKKKKFVVGASVSADLKGAVKMYEYYCGFWSTKTDKISVSEFINKFAVVTNIEELDVKHYHYRSFHVSVSSEFNDKMIDPNNWPTGVRVKRFFLPKVNRNTSDEKHAPKKSYNNSQRGNYSRGRGGSVRGSHRPPISDTPVNIGASETGTYNALSGANKRRLSPDLDQQDSGNIAKIANNAESDPEREYSQTK